jgi:hypothetical protein
MYEKGTTEDYLVWPDRNVICDNIYFCCEPGIKDFEQKIRFVMSVVYALVDTRFTYFLCINCMVRSNEILG